MIHRKYSPEATAQAFLCLRIHSFPFVRYKPAVASAAKCRTKLSCLRPQGSRINTSARKRNVCVVVQIRYCVLSSAKDHSRRSWLSKRVVLTGMFGSIIHLRMNPRVLVSGLVNIPDIGDRNILRHDAQAVLSGSTKTFGHQHRDDQQTAGATVVGRVPTVLRLGSASSASVATEPGC